PGLAAHAIREGWWLDDGTKLDFAGAVGLAPTGLEAGLRRWGRTTLLLEDHNGGLDLPAVRRLLSDHYEGTRDEADPSDVSDGPPCVCRHPRPDVPSATAGSFIATLSTDPERMPVLWAAFGPPCLGVYLPIFLEGELPAPFAPDT